MSVAGDGNAVTGLGGPFGYGEQALARSDDASVLIDVSAVFPGGFDFFGAHFSGDELYVNTNGNLSFGVPFTEYPTVENSDVFQNLIAPFWADVDTRIDGEGAESGRIWLDLDGVSKTVTVTWENVGSYRRYADQTNLFQLQLVNQGAGDFDIVMRFERIDWTLSTGDEDAGAKALLSANLLPKQIMLEGRPEMLDSDIGNTGVAGLWLFEMRGGGSATNQPVSGLALNGTSIGDVLNGGSFDDILRGFEGNDILRGNDGNDWLKGGDGADILNGGHGDDFIFGGETEADLRDVVYAGDGNDQIDAGYGNDLVFGGDGADIIGGGFGVDELIGQNGNDVITGAAYSDLIFGGAGSDFINGGFGFDRLNGGDDADRFFHLGIADHGSDWIQDYGSAEDDVLLWGGGAANPGNFQVNFADTPGAGVAGVSEAFVIYRPTGQIIWALVDGEAEPEINLKIGGGVFDLMA